MIDFWLRFFGKVLIFLRGREAFPGNKFSKTFSKGIPLLNFRISDFTMKNFTTFLGGWDPFFINNYAFSIHNEPFSRGEIALIFPNFQIQNLLITLDWRLLDAFWCHFWTLSIFHVFACEIIVFWYHFFEKITNFLRGWDAFFVKKFTEHLPAGDIALKFAIFCEFCEKFKLLISLD